MGALFEPLHPHYRLNCREKIGDELLKEEKQEMPEENEQIDETDDPSLEEGLTESEQAELIVEDEEEEVEEDVEAEDDPVEEVAEEVPDEEPPQRRGCLWGCLIPVATILVVCIAVISIVYVQWGAAINKSIRHKIIANTQTNALGNLPDGMADGEIEELKTVFEKVKTALDEGMIHLDILDEVIREYQDAAREDTSQKRQAINNLKAGLNRAISADDD